MRKEKQLLLDEIAEKLKGSTAFVVMRYQNMDPNLSYLFREHLRKVKGEFYTVQKRVFLKASESCGVSFDGYTLHGHVGIVYSLEEPLDVVKSLYEFSKTQQDVLEVLGGYYDGEVCSSDTMKTISALPSLDELRAQLVGVIQAPLVDVVSAINALLTSVMNCIDNKIQKDGSES